MCKITVHRVTEIKITINPDIHNNSQEELLKEAIMKLKILDNSSLLQPLRDLQMQQLTSSNLPQGWEVNQCLLYN